LLGILIGFLLFASFPSARAQGWIQDKKSMYSLGLGGTQPLFLPFAYYPAGRAYSLGLSINISGEYRVHRLIGIGWQTGLNLFTSGYYYRYHGQDGYYYRAAAIGIPIGFKANFHILEATRAQIKDRLDVYAGLNIGGGPAIYLGPGAGLYGFIYVGPQIGARYWFDKVAIFGEIGWGATFANIGVTFR
ncbi:MAG: hypothetical protein JWO06_2474, partial [Bacteroidota bacterium]|nr:hypothetical protein [Bacteroidota bacterium]